MDSSTTDEEDPLIMDEDMCATSEEHEVGSPYIVDAQGHEVLCGDIDNAFI